MSRDPKDETPETPDALATLEREFRRFWTSLQDEGVDGAKAQVEARLRTTPWLVLGAAGVLGLFVGYLFGRRRRK